MYEPGTRHLVGVEAVIDKDFASAVLARDLGADLLVIATDAPAVFLDWGTDAQRAILRAHPEDLKGLDFAAGSMGPKVAAAVDFVTSTGNRAVIGDLDDLQAMVEGSAGTQISVDSDGIETQP